MNDNQVTKLYPIRKDKKEGYIDASGKIVIQPEFCFASLFSFNVAPVGMYPQTCPYNKCAANLILKNYEICPGPAGCDYCFPLWGCIDEYGRYAAELQFEVAPALYCQSKIFAAVKDGKWGFVRQYCDVADENRVKIEFVVSPTFEAVEPFYSDELVCVRVNGKWGYINLSGNFEIPPQFADAYNFSDGLARVRIKDFQDMINMDGIHYFEERMNGKYGFIDKQGEFVIEPKFYTVGDFNEGLAVIIIDGKYGYIDKDGNYAIKPRYDFAEKYADGLACAKTKFQKYGFIDHQGKFVISGFDHVESFKEGYALIKKSGKYGFIDKNGNYFKSPQFEDARSFYGEIAPVELNGKFHYINKKGEVVWCSDEFPYIWFKTKSTARILDWGAFTPIQLTKDQYMDDFRVRFRALL